VRLGALGDVVRTRFAFPALRELYPDARIDWLVEDRAAPGLEGIVGLDESVVVPRRELRPGRPGALLGASRQLIRELRSRRYDLAIDFHSILKSALLVWAARIPARVGHEPPLGREGSPFLANHRVAVENRHISRFERDAALLRYLGARVPRQVPPLELDPGAAAGLAGLPDAFYALHPGTSPSTIYKRWDPDRFGGVVRILAERTGVPCVVTWGPVEGELDAAQQVVAASAGAGLLAPATGSISALLALLQRARLFIGSDSGPMRLASLAGRPVLAILGPTDPIENCPFPGLGARVIRHDVGCNPCRKGCPARTCMAAISVPEVAEVALEMLGDC